MLHLLEWLCAVTVVLFVLLLALATNYGALAVTYENGDLTPAIMVFALACVGWPGLRLTRTRRLPLAWLLVACACTVGLVAAIG